MTTTLKESPYLPGGLVLGLNLEEVNPHHQQAVWVSTLDRLGLGLQVRGTQLQELVAMTSYRMIHRAATRPLDHSR